MRIRLTTDISPADLSVMDVDALDDWADALADLGASPTCCVDLRFDGPARFSVTAAFERVVVILGATDVSLVDCIVPNRRVSDHLTRLLPPGQRPSLSVDIGRVSVHLEVADVLERSVDAIVNASNVELTLGGGVSGAIRRACRNPRELQVSMHAAAPIERGAAVVTASAGLRCARWIIHAATARGGLSVVERAFHEVLAIAAQRGFRSLAIPALGAGTGRVPALNCAGAAREALQTTAFEGRVHFALYDASMFRAFESVFSDR